MKTTGPTHACMHDDDDDDGDDGDDDSDDDDDDDETTLSATPLKSCNTQS